MKGRSKADLRTKPLFLRRLFQNLPVPAFVGTHAADQPSLFQFSQLVLYAEKGVTPFSFVWAIICKRPATNQLKLNSKIVFCVIKADVFNHFTKQIHIRRNFTILNISADQVAENATEIFVTRIGKEAAAVGQHADKAAVVITKHTDMKLLDPTAGVVHLPDFIQEPRFKFFAKLLLFPFFSERSVDSQPLAGVTKGSGTPQARGRFPRPKRRRVTLAAALQNQISH
jgi:hypothetical protein